MIVVDTSVWVSAQLAEDVNFQESSAWYQMWGVRSLPMHFPTLLIPEFSAVLARRGVVPAEVANAVGNIVGRQTIALHELDVTSSLLAARVSSLPGLKGADAVFVALAAWLDLPLVTWDRQQRERGALFCRTMTPVEAMEMTE